MCSCRKFKIEAVEGIRNCDIQLSDFVAVGNSKIVSKNTNDNKGALIEISKEKIKEQTLNRVMSASTHHQCSKRVKWKDEIATSEKAMRS